MILVTGGAGFIGSVLVKELNRAGHTNIIIVDRLKESDKWKNLKELKYSDYYHADEFLSSENDDLFSELTCIFHMGACSSTTERDMDYLMKNNVYFTQSLFEIARNQDIPFIYASSAATYGDGELGYSDQHETIPNLRALNPYGYSKQLVDEWILKQKYKPKHWFGLKFFNVYGPNEGHKGEMRSLVHKAYGQILETGKVKLFKSHREGFKDGQQLRDFVYVVDVVKAMIEMMNPKVMKHSGIYNLGSGKARSFLSLIEATFQAMDKTSNIEFIDMPPSIRNQYQYFTEADMNKFKAVFPNFKFHSLEEGVRDYVQNYLAKNRHY